MSTDDMHKAAIESLAKVGTERAVMLAMEIQRGMDRARQRPEVERVEVEVQANHTVPATIHQYLLWLRGFVANGGKPTHRHDLPFSMSGLLYSPVDFAVNGECGSDSMDVIVERGANVLNPNPWKPFGGYGHNNLFLMDGYQLIGRIEAEVYSDPEFDRFRRRPLFSRKGRNEQ